MNARFSPNPPPDVTSFAPSSPESDALVPTLVLIHDALGTPAEFEALKTILGTRQVPFDALEIPGYTHGRGRSCLAWRDWLAAASAALDARHGAGAPIALGGLGTGGALAAALALERRPQQVRGVVLLSATFVCDGPAASLTPLQRAAMTVGLDRWLSIARSEPFGIKNPKTRKWIAREFDEKDVTAIGPKRLPLRVVRERAKLHAHVRADLHTLAPLLVLHASEDDVSSIASVEAIVAACGRRARLIALEHSYRMITVDNDRQRVAHELADFIGAPKRNAGTPTNPTRAARVAVAH